MDKYAKILLDFISWLKKQNEILGDEYMNPENLTDSKSGAMNRGIVYGRLKVIAESIREIDRLREKSIRKDVFKKDKWTN